MSIAPSIHSAPTQQELSALRDQLGQAVVCSMREIAQASKCAKEEGNLDEAIWYPEEYAKALLASGRGGKRYEFLRDHEHLMAGWLNNRFFIPIRDQSQGQRVRCSWSFLAKKDKIPSEALKAAKQGFSLLDCGSCCQLARYDALYRVLGEKKFNRLFSEQRINTGYIVDDELQPMRYFVEFTKAAIRPIFGSVNSRCIKIGQSVLFRGVPEYHYKHFLGGCATNFNVICSENEFESQRYVGHGLSPEGVTEEQIAQRLIEGYNADFDPQLRTPTSLKDELEQLLKERGEKIAPEKMSLEEPFKKVGGYDAGSPQDFCVQLIYDLVKIPLELVSMAYVKAHPFANKNFLIVDSSQRVNYLKDEMQLAEATRRINLGAKPSDYFKI